MTEYDKMISGKEHYPRHESLLELSNKAHEICNQFNTEKDAVKREAILKSLLGKMGTNCYITPNFFCDYGCNLRLGNDVYFNTNCVVLDSAIVTIGDNTLIGPSCQFYTPIHPLDYKSRNTFIETAKPITIGKNCWLGGNVVVLPDVTIGDGCVIGAGSVVTKDIPENSLAVGNPARVIKKIEQK